MPEFCHLHCHTQYSLLDGAAHIDAYMAKAKADGMKGLAITDHGNMFGAFKFFASAKKHGLTPVIGCEFYLVADRWEKEFKNGRKDKRYHQLLLAKDADGYRNLSKLCSLGFMEGLYGKYPRIDKELLHQYKDGLIATTCCVAAEVPQTFYNEGPEAAERVFLEWLGMFGDDYYIELQRHHLKGIDQEAVNQFLLKMSAKHGVPVIATNDSHYVDQDDWLAHDILLCVNTGDFQSTPVGDKDPEAARLLLNGKFEYAPLQQLARDFPGNATVSQAIRAYEANNRKMRFGFENDQFYFKTGQEMADLFKDTPQAIENTLAVLEKINPPELKRDILVPNYALPEGFSSQWDYLKHITFERGRQRFEPFNDLVAERLNFELEVIKATGYAGYFLIVQDFVEAAKRLGVRVGPGRGSAAGSAIAFAIGITNIDPLKYNLLFERFLNPERISMPDIDIDFDDVGRQKVIDYVVDKYGKNQVAQIITYGTMAAKSSIRDVGRVMQYPLPDTDHLAKLVPEGPGVSLTRAFKENKELGNIRKNEEETAGKVLALAEKLEGSVRQRGIHAAGVIIAPDDITNYIPVCTAPDSDLLVTQFEGKYIEDAGMLKMDFLGLKNLSIINDALKLIEENHGTAIDIDDIPLDDPKTLELYQHAQTIGTFQFESDGMREHLHNLKPTSIEDLIAMNALYRPGPMDFIESYIRRKHGLEAVSYPHPLLEDLLKPTYGIMVYQEQIMQAGQIIGGFSLGKADKMRRAMGKKNMAEMQEAKAEFVAGAARQEIEQEKAEEIFGFMEKFALYGFNRSHAAAYSVLAFQTAYLKANYPAEYMAAVLTHNMHDLKKLTFFLQECRRMKVTTLGPDVNESELNFTVNGKGEVRFGLAGIKGVGEAAVEAIVEERESGGPYTGIFDLTKRVNLRSVNKKCLESLAMAGAFDSFGANRSQYFQPMEDGFNVLERAVRFGNQFQVQKSTVQNSLFGEDVMVATVENPDLPASEPWSHLEQLEKEQEVTGMYLSGHPLDGFRLELEQICTPISQIEDQKGRDVKIGGLVRSSVVRMDKRGRAFARFTMEDFSGSTAFMLFSENFIKYKNYLEAGTSVIVNGKYRKRNDSDHYEMQVSSLELLSEARDKYTKSLRIIVRGNLLLPATINALEELLTQNKGQTPVVVSVTDRENTMDITYVCRKYMVNLSNEFLEQLADIAGIQYRLAKGSRN